MSSKEQIWYSNPDLKFPALTETRWITFPKDALIAAIKFLASISPQSIGPSLPPGVLESCDIAANPDIAVTLGIRNEASGELVKVVIPAETMGAAMIAYCRQVNVPLPRTAEKSLNVSGDNLVLVVQVKSRPTKLLHHLDAQRLSGKTAT